MTRVSPRQKFTGGGQKNFSENQKNLVGGDTYPSTDACGGGQWGGISNLVGGDTGNVPKITFFSDYVQKLSSILGKIGSNDRKSNNFLENRVKNCNFRRKIEIFGTSRRHRRGSKHLVGGDPPQKNFSGASRRHLWGGDPPPLISDFMGGDFGFYGGGICPKIFLRLRKPQQQPVMCRLKVDVSVQEAVTMGV